MNKDFMKRAAAWLARRRQMDDTRAMRMSVNLADEAFREAFDESQAEALGQLPNIRCGTCGGRGNRCEALDALHGDWVKAILGRRPLANESLDQAPVGVQQMYADIAFILDRLSDEESFLFLGDDDFHSLVLARYAPWLTVQVLEADQRIVTSANDLAKEHDLRVTAAAYDAQADLPSALTGKFDAFYSDPPYSPFGAHLFANRGIAALRPVPGTWGLMALPMTLLPEGVRLMLRDIEEHVLRNGFAILDVVPAHKCSPHSKGIVSGLLRFERVCDMSSPMPEFPQDTLYSHFY